MVNQIKSSVLNSVKEWKPFLRYKIGQVVIYQGLYYQNNTGKNTNPTLLNDWIKIIIEKDFIPRTGTTDEEEKKVSGNIGFQDGDNSFEIYNTNSSDRNFRGSLFFGGSSIGFTSQNDEGGSSLQFLPDGLALVVTDPTSRGISGEMDYSDNYEDLDFVQNKYVRQLTGWNDRVDTVTNQSLAANTDNLIQITTTLNQNGEHTLLDSNSKITPESLNDLISFDFAFQYTAPSGSNNFLQVYLKVNGFVYRASTHVMVRPTGTTDYVSVSFVLPVKNDFLTHGGLIYVNPSTPITISNRYIAVGQLHKGY